MLPCGTAAGGPCREVGVGGGGMFSSRKVDAVFDRLSLVGFVRGSLLLMAGVADALERLALPFEMAGLGLS